MIQIKQLTVSIYPEYKSDDHHDDSENDDGYIDQELNQIEPSQERVALVYLDVACLFVWTQETTRR